MSGEKPFLRAYVATPCIDKRYFSGYVEGLVSAARSPFFAGWIYIEQESDIVRGRGQLATLLLVKIPVEKAEYMLFVDADITWSIADLEAALRTEEDVVAGCYPLKEPGGKIVAAGLGRRHAVHGALVEVERAGTGFLLVRRRVFEKIAELGLAKKYNWMNGAHSFWWNFFPNGPAPRPDVPEVDDYYSEDFGFCRLAKLAGFTVWLHQEIRLQHTGSHAWKCPPLRLEGGA